MDRKEIKQRIKRRIKKGKFNTIVTNMSNIQATARVFGQSWCYYTELKNDSLLAYNTLTNQLTIYVLRNTK